MRGRDDDEVQLLYHFFGNAQAEVRGKIGFTAEGEADSVRLRERKRISNMRVVLWPVPVGKTGRDPLIPEMIGDADFLQAEFLSIRENALRGLGGILGTAGKL